MNDDDNKPPKPKRKERSDKGKKRKPAKRGRPKLDGRTKFARTKEGKENRRYGGVVAEEVNTGQRPKKEAQRKHYDEAKLYPDLTEDERTELAKWRDDELKGWNEFKSKDNLSPRVRYIAALDEAVNTPHMIRKLVDDFTGGRITNSPEYYRPEKYEENRRRYFAALRVQNEAHEKEKAEYDEHRETRDPRCAGCCAGMPVSSLWDGKTEAELEQTSRSIGFKVSPWTTNGGTKKLRKNPQGHLPVFASNDSFTIDQRAEEDADEEAAEMRANGDGKWHR